MGNNGCKDFTVELRVFQYTQTCECGKEITPHNIRMVDIAYLEECECGKLYEVYHTLNIDEDNKTATTHVFQREYIKENREMVDKRAWTIEIKVNDIDWFEIEEVTSVEDGIIRVATRFGDYTIFAAKSLIGLRCSTLSVCDDAGLDEYHDIIDVLVEAMES